MGNTLATVKARATALRQKLNAAPTERKVGLALAGFTLGTLYRRKTIPTTIMGFPSKPMLAIGAALVEANSTGLMHKVAAAIGDTAIAVYTYRAAMEETLIAGDDDDDGEV
jgi:hypothetical protein